MASLTNRLKRVGLPTPHCSPFGAVHRHLWLIPTLAFWSLPFVTRARSRPPAGGGLRQFSQTSAGRLGDPRRATQEGSNYVIKGSVFENGQGGTGKPSARVFRNRLPSRPASPPIWGRAKR